MEQEYCLLYLKTAAFGCLPVGLFSSVKKAKEYIDYILDGKDAPKTTKFLMQGYKMDVPLYDAAEILRKCAFMELPDVGAYPQTSWKDQGMQ